MCNGKNTMEIKQDCNIELPPGFRFHPTDDELVSFYLTRKIKNPHFAVKSIPNVSLNKCEPWDLPEKAKVGEKEWYFFSLRDRKYPTGIRTNRATEKGYWKATGKDRDVMNCSTHLLVGMKKTLVFYLGRAPKGEKTNWIMHEYRLENDLLSNHLNNHESHQSKNHEWVVCRVFQKMVGNKKPGFMYAGMPIYQLADSHDALPGNHRDNSPNPTVTDSDDCDTYTAAESCYNCQDSLRGAVDHVAQEFRQGHATSVVAHQLPAPGSIPMATPAMDVYHYNMMKEPYYNHQNSAEMVKLFSPPPQSMISHPLTTVNGNRMRAKLEPSHNPYSEGEDEVESSQRLNNLDYAWPDDALNAEYFPCDGSLLPLQSVAEDSSQTSTCFTDGGGLFNRTLRGSFSGLSEVAGPAMDVLQEWSY